MPRANASYPLNQLLVEMGGFDNHKGIIVMVATNRPEILDPALLRAGRFDRQVLVDRPDLRGRKEILEVHADKIKLDGDVDLEEIAKLTPGLAGAPAASGWDRANRASWGMRNGDGVYTPRKRDAKRLARAVDPAGRVDYHDPHVNRETGTADGRYSHYHPATTHQGHAWFGTAA